MVAVFLIIHSPCLKTNSYTAVWTSLVSAKEDRL